jgi:hypothetical protein
MRKQCIPIALSPHDINRFWALVDRQSGDERSCWLFKGGANTSGHGTFSTNGRRGPTLYAHRVAWSLCNGPIPDGLLVLHNCPDGDNPAYVNPRHLYLGTRRDNAVDAELKGQSLHSRVTHCPNGHPYSLTNTYFDRHGKRSCQQCRRSNEARYRIRHGKQRPGDVAAMAREQIGDRT